ncbi:MAG: hypothetical protein D3922_02125 [Candidatus Electrothrix sp. AR1]|nr:hypothetical protein [Candidatus Electrothrix sp. AR1]
MESIDTLFAELRQRNAFLLGIDGELGAGKTTLAKMLSNSLDADCIHLDEFLNDSIGSYLQRINYSTLESILKVKKCRLIIEGICLVAVLEKLNLNVDYNIFVRVNYENYSMDSLDCWLIEYKSKYQPEKNADLIIESREINMKTQHDVDILYIKSKALFSSLLAFGGILSIVIGGLLISSENNFNNQATIKILGSELNAQGIGAVILCTSIAWAFLAYKSRPIYQTKREKRISKNNDGSIEEYEIHSSTRAMMRNDS